MQAHKAIRKTEPSTSQYLGQVSILHISFEKFIRVDNARNINNDLTHSIMTTL